MPLRSRLVVWSEFWSCVCLLFLVIFFYVHTLCFPSRSLFSVVHIWSRNLLPTSVTNYLYLNVCLNYVIKCRKLCNTLCAVLAFPLPVSFKRKLCVESFLLNLPSAEYALYILSIFRHNVKGLYLLPCFVDIRGENSPG